MNFVFAFLLGVVSGLRALTPLAAVSWAAHLGWLKVSGTALAFMGFKYTPIVFTVLAIGELINDKLPKTPSRKTPPQFIARILSGSLAGGTVGAANGSLITGVVAGAFGAVVGTYGGAAMRGRLAAAFGKDLPAALVEDVFAVVLAVGAVMRFQ
jgi:uncharacterized membrane protein